MKNTLRSLFSWSGLLAILLLILLSAHGFGQNFRSDGVVQARTGVPAPGALVAVCTQPCTVPSNVSISTPPSPLASLCSSASDVGCTSPNPVTADGLGNYHFYVKPGKYSVVFYGSGLTASTQTDQIFPCDPSNCSLSGILTQPVAEKFTETAAPTCVLAFDFLWGDSTAHRLKQCDNNGSPVQIVNAGGDINNNDQVTVTHLAAALPVLQGGTGVTVAQGTGPKNQLAAGTTTTSDFLSYDANGNAIDSTKAVPTGAVVGTTDTQSLSGKSFSDITRLTANRVAVATDFTTANNTSLQAITGLSWTFPATAANYSFHCGLLYSQATANTGINFGIQAATNNPTNISALGVMELTIGPPSTFVASGLATLSTTTATAIVGSTPGATATNYTMTIDGTLELAASTNTVNIMVSTAAGADAVTIKRGSYCNLF